MQIDITSLNSFQRALYGFIEWVRFFQPVITIALTLSIFFYGKRVLFQPKMEHRDEVRKKLRGKIEEIKEGNHVKVEFYNQRRFNFSYDSLNQNHNCSLKDMILGYAVSSGYLDGYGVDGVHFVANGIKEIKLDDNSSSVKASLIGVVRYEDIQWIDEFGDDTTIRMIIYLRTSLFRFPYRNFSEIRHGKDFRNKKEISSKAYYRYLLRVFRYRWFDKS